VLAAFESSDYTAELRERTDRLGEPPDSPRRPETILRIEANSGVFLYDPDLQGAGPGGDGPADVDGRGGDSPGPATGSGPAGGSDTDDRSGG
jgi:hypothetical protein